MPENDIETQLAKLNELTENRNELMRKLNRSLAIEKLWPGCFANGSVRSNLVGSRYRGFKFTLKDGTGEERIFELDKVPEILLQDYKDVLEAAKRRW